MNPDSVPQEFYEDAAARDASSQKERFMLGSLKAAKVMPIVLSGHESGYARLVAQRDADWLRMLPVLTGIETVVREAQNTEDFKWVKIPAHIFAFLRDALTNLSVEVKE